MVADRNRLVGFSFMIHPLLDQPPIAPLPDPSEDAKWYGDIWIKYPLNQSLIPTSFGHVFRAKCQFRIIMNEFCQAAYAEGTGPAVTLDQANALHSKLRGWYDGLPGPLQAKVIALPGHLQLQYVPPTSRRSRLLSAAVSFADGVHYYLLTTAYTIIT